jgi:hypothetical protein
MIYFTVNAADGFAAHAQIISGMETRLEKVGYEFRVIYVETGAIAFAGIGHGLSRAYNEWRGEHEHYLFDDLVWQQVVDIAGEEISQERYEQLRLI